MNDLKSKLKIVIRSIRRCGFIATLEKIRRTVNRDGQKYLAKSLRLTEAEIGMQKNHRFANEPLISLIVPLYNTPENFLRDMIESVRRQTYAGWQLCMADGSDDGYEYVGNIACEYAQADSRIIYRKLAENAGISANTNACIQLAAGEYLGMLDHDDILSVDALYETVRAINEQGADFIYSDEVKFEGSIENAYAPNYKPNFSKDELRAHNYICHFNVYKKSLISKAGGMYRPECNGSQDHDMVLRLTEVAESIVHIPRILYYWRVHSNSVAQGVENKMYAVEAAHRAISDQLQRVHEPGRVRSAEPYITLYRIDYELPEDCHATYFIYNVKTRQDLVNCCQSLQRCLDGQKHDIVVLNCQDIYRDKSLPVRYYDGEIDALPQEFHAKFFVFCDAACTATSDRLHEEMVGFLQRPDVCAAGAKVTGRHRIRSAGIILDDRKKSGYADMYSGYGDENHGYEAALMHTRNVTAVEPCFMGIKRADFACCRALKGQSLRDFLFNAELYHTFAGKLNVWIPFINADIGRHELPVSGVFRQNWHDYVVQGDIYFNPNLNFYEKYISGGK